MEPVHQQQTLSGLATLTGREPERLVFVPDERIPSFILNWKLQIPLFCKIKFEKRWNP